MEKPALLRAEIEKHLPEIRENPDKLAMFVTEGRIIAHKATLGHEVRFNLSILITDFVGNIDILRTLIIHWLQTHQPDILGPGGTDANAFTFEAEILGSEAADILITLKLSERTTALIGDNGTIRISHPADACHKNVLGVIGA